MKHINRSAIKNGFFQNMAKEAEAKGLINLTSATAREQSWRKILNANPNSNGDVWVFAYGSLLWNPAFNLIDTVNARLEGYHRDFCLRTYIGRGSEQQPGLVLGLEQGGCCRGQALLVDPNGLEEEIDLLWSREMLSSAYSPKWLKLTTPNNNDIYAIAFVMDKNYRHYAGHVDFDERCHALAHAKGALGTSSEYLFETVNALEKMNISDELLKRYAEKVTRVISGMQNSTVL